MKSALSLKTIHSHIASIENSTIIMRRKGMSRKERRILRRLTNKNWEFAVSIRDDKKEFKRLNTRRQYRVTRAVVTGDNRYIDVSNIPMKYIHMLEYSPRIYDLAERLDSGDYNSYREINEEMIDLARGLINKSRRVSVMNEQDTFRMFNSHMKQNEPKPFIMYYDQKGNVLNV
ncbi:hypothetical protein D3C73_1111760 [compost metagenome]